MPYVRHWLCRYRDHVLRTVEQRKASYVAALTQFELQQLDTAAPLADGSDLPEAGAAALVAAAAAEGAAAEGGEPCRRRHSSSGGEAAADGTVVVRAGGADPSADLACALQAAAAAAKAEWLPSVVGSPRSGLAFPSFSSVATAAAEPMSDGSGGGDSRTLDDSGTLAALAASAVAAGATQGGATHSGAAAGNTSRAPGGSLAELVRQAPALLAQVHGLLAQAPQQADEAGSASAAAAAAEEDGRRVGEVWQECAEELGSGVLAAALPPT